MKCPRLVCLCIYLWIEYKCTVPYRNEKKNTETPEWGTNYEEKAKEYQKEDNFQRFVCSSFLCFCIFSLRSRRTPKYTNTSMCRLEWYSLFSLSNLDGKVEGYFWSVLFRSTRSRRNHSEHQELEVKIQQNQYVEVIAYESISFADHLCLFHCSNNGHCVYIVLFSFKYVNNPMEGKEPIVVNRSWLEILQIFFFSLGSMWDFSTIPCSILSLGSIVRWINMWTISIPKGNFKILSILVCTFFVLCECSVRCTA